MINKYQRIGLVIFAFIVMGFMGVRALAQSVNSGPGSFSSGNLSPMIVNIGPGGKALIRGVVDGAPGTDSIKVESWGGVWKVQVSSATQLMSVNKSISDFQDGDFVGVIGTISTDGSFVVDAQLVREWRGKAEHEILDSDHDGILNNEDLDDDNDGILDVNESGKSKDHDNDGIPDATDTDDDGDGVLDVNDNDDDDFDNDGVKDSRDDDDDNDGLDDHRDGKPHDFDDDGKDNDDDEDDDNDGKSDDSDDDDDGDGNNDDDEDEEDDDDSSGRGN
jgi:hypothetical protein